MMAGVPTGVYWPVKVSAPSFLSRRKAAIASLRWLQENRKLAAGIDAEAPRIIAASPFLAEQRQDARFGNREPRDAVVQPVGGIDELPVGRDHDLRREIGPGESFRQAGNRLFRRQPPARGVVGEDGDRRGFFLQRIEPAAAGVESEMPRPVAGRQCDQRRIVLDKPAALNIELPDEDPVPTEVAGENESSGRVGLDHVRVRAFVAADGKTSRRRAGRTGWANVARAGFDVGRGPEFAVGAKRQHGHGAAGVVGHEDVLARRVNAEMRGAGAFGADRIDQRQVSVGTVDRSTALTEPELAP